MSLEGIISLKIAALFCSAVKYFYYAEAASLFFTIKHYFLLITKIMCLDFCTNLYDVIKLFRYQGFSKDLYFLQAFFSRNLVYNYVLLRVGQLCKLFCRIGCL